MGWMTITPSCRRGGRNVYVKMSVSPLAGRGEQRDVISCVWRCWVSEVDMRADAPGT